MGTLGLDKWYWRMEDHVSKGHRIIAYPQNKRVNAIENELLFKDERAAFWEKNRRIPTADDLLWWEREVEA